MCRQLSDDDRELLRLRFVEDKTQQEIADLVGVSQMQVSRRLAKVLDGLRTKAGYADAA
ncbi:sigma-70 family RNA polymerase sigma factor [Aeromicrobium sp. UC242_57]|uniref:sigma-70 family RNA polymerase sigma factor n=1 Tax=Aeromicrobium sp. UC242_57 TaxID=3374624 RepID=UPI0037C0BC05